MGTYASLYEALFPLTSIMLTRFVEFFIGKDIDTNVWLKGAGVGTPVYQMSDVEDEGYEVTTSTASGDRSDLSHNVIRVFSNTASEFIANAKLVTATSISHLFGFIDNTFALFANGVYVDCRDAASANFQITTYGSATGTSTDSTVVMDTSWHLHQIIQGSANAKYYIDGVLRVTKTTNLPAGKMQPFIKSGTTTTAIRTLRIKYFEAFNTLASGQVYTSIYELFYKLTTIGKQFFVEWFVGNDLNTNIWTISNNAGSRGTATTADVENGGLALKTGALLYDNIVINHNLKRQFIHNSSICTVIAKTPNSSPSEIDLDTGFGLGDSNTLTGNFAGCEISSGNFSLSTELTGVGRTITTMQAIDTNYHVFQFILGSSNVKGYIDGVLKATNSTNLPNAKMSPLAMCQNNALVAVELDLLYFEARNV